MKNNLNLFLELVEEWENGNTAEATEKLDHEFFSDETCFEIIKKYPYNTGLLVHNEHLSLPVLRKLALDKDWQVRFYVAKKSSLDYVLLKKLSQDKDASVRRSVAMNKITPVEILQQMYPDDDEIVNKRLQERLSKKFPDSHVYQEADAREYLPIKEIKNAKQFVMLVEEGIAEWEDQDTTTITSALYTQVIPDEVCFEIIKNYPSYILNLVQNEHLSLPVLRKLASNKSWLIRTFIAQRDILDYGLFEKLSRDKDISVRTYIAYNRKTPLAILKKMYPDTDNEINEILQENILEKEKIEKN